jgi:hypothetical protein
MLIILVTVRSAENIVELALTVILAVKELMKKIARRL